MKKFKAELIFRLGVTMGQFSASEKDLLSQVRAMPIGDKEAAVARNLLPVFIKLADDIGLPTASIPLNEILERLRRAPELATVDFVSQKHNAFKDRVKDELAQHSFYQIQSGRAKYYDDALKEFGESVTSAFPSSANDIEEAGRCLAVGRATACVFHLMRAITPVLQAAAAHLGFPEQRDWGKYLTEMKAAIWRKYPDDKTAGNDAERGYYSELEAQLRAYKEAWRNSTMHNPDSVYTEERAEEIFGIVKGFMRKAAEKLKEKP